jgi:type IV pilus biogenesis protein CpaD/CtpE
MTLFLKSLISLFVCCFLSSCASLNSRSLDHTEPRQFVILKLDDYRADVPVTKGWSQTFEFLNQNNVIGTLGIIGEG